MSHYNEISTFNLLRQEIEALREERNNYFDTICAMLEAAGVSFEDLDAAKAHMDANGPKPSDTIRALREERDALREAGKLPRNTRWSPEKHFEGEWVVIPKEDFDEIRALARKPKARE